MPDVRVATAPDNGAAQFALSEMGTLLFIRPRAPGPPSTTLWCVDRHGREEPLPLAPGRYGYPRVSPDGARIAVDVPGANRDIWIWDVQRSNLMRLTTGAAEDMLPTWHPDGRLFFASLRQGNFDLYSQAPDGASAEHVEFAGAGDQMPNGFTPDGTRLIVNENFKDLSDGRPVPRPEDRSGGSRPNHRHLGRVELARRAEGTGPEPMSDVRAAHPNTSALGLKVGDAFAKQAR